MIGLIWNCQGLGKDVKSEFLKEIMRKERFDFIGLQETNKKNFEESLLNTIDFINVTNLPMNQPSNIDRSLLTAPFCINEIKKVVFELKHNSATGPDGFPAEFFQDFWELIHMDIWNLFKDFYVGNLDIKRSNYGMVTLLPTVDNAVEMKNFRPICLLNVCYKIITKVLNNRLASCITKVISDSQYGFIQGRYIMDRVVSLNEILHEVKTKKQSGVVLKIDFEKTCDKVNWHFLYFMMDKKRFSEYLV
jgi:hypothetical protein